MLRRRPAKSRSLASGVEGEGPRCGSAQCFICYLFFQNGLYTNTFQWPSFQLFAKGSLFAKPQPIANGGFHNSNGGSQLHSQQAIVIMGPLCLFLCVHPKWKYQKFQTIIVFFLRWEISNKEDCWYSHHHAAVGCGWSLILSEWI